MPCYKLIGEVFELQGHLQWLRRQIIYLVRITFGSSFERQIALFMGWLCAEAQVCWYLQTANSALFHAPAAPAPSPAQREDVRARVRGGLLNAPPHLLLVLFGPSMTRRGLLKLLNTVDQPLQTKQLLYTVLELFLLHSIGTTKKTKKRSVAEGAQSPTASALHIIPNIP